MNVPQPSPRVRTAIREVILVAVLFLAYKIGRLAADGHVSDALSNAQSIWSFERALHLPSEAGIQDAIIHHRSLVRAANMYYAFVHFPATIAGLVWLYLRRPVHYTWTRRLLAWLTAAALVLHLLLPLAPPRMLLDIGMIDTGAVYGPSVYGPPDTDTLANQFAAMPSLHVGWALAVAIGLITATRTRWRWAWLAHPVITLFVVVATGNHYWLDAVVAGGLLAFLLAVMPRPVVADRERQPAGVRRSGSLPPPEQRAGS
jgi:PAP2 superfamily